MLKINIALIYPKEVYGLNSVHTNSVFSNQGVLPPLTLLYIATELNKNGHKCKIIDANAENLSLSEVTKIVIEEKIEMVGFSIHADSLKFNLPYIKKVKEKTKCPIFVGGVNVEYFYEKLIKEEYIDYVARGNSLDLLKFVNSLTKGENLNNINGLVSKKNKKIYTNDYINKREDFLKYSLPDWSLLNVKLYHSFLTPNGFGTVLGSIGCPYGCIYCSQRRSKVYFRPTDEIIKELQQLQNLGIYFVEFYDDIMTLNKKWIIELCKKIVENNLKLKFAFQTRIDLIDEEMLLWLKKSGCVRINFGIESGNEKILDTIGKGIDLNKVDKTINLVKKYNIASLGYFTFGHPGETKESMYETLKFAMSLPLTYVILMEIVPYMDTKLHELHKDNIGNYWENNIYSVNKKRIANVGTKLTHKEVSKFIDYSYRKFYLRPKQIIRVIRHVNSFKELLGYIKAGITYVF